MAESKINNQSAGDHDIGIAGQSQKVLGATLRRLSTEDYLERCLARPFPDTTLDPHRDSFYLRYTTSINPSYLDSAYAATKYLDNRLEAAVGDYQQFRRMLQTYTRKSAYASTTSYSVIPDYLNSGFGRHILVPGPIYHYLHDLTSRLRSDEQAGVRRDVGITPPTNSAQSLSVRMQLPELKQRIEAVRMAAGETLRIGDLRTAIYTLYTMERSWFWDRGNHSRSMNFFNVLLGKIGYQPISHGVIDFAAFTLDFEDFRRYVTFVMRDVEGQRLQRRPESTELSS